MGLLDSFRKMLSFYSTYASGHHVYQQAVWFLEDCFSSLKQFCFMNTIHSLLYFMLCLVFAATVSDIYRL